MLVGCSYNHPTVTLQPQGNCRAFVPNPAHHVGHEGAGRALYVEHAALQAQVQVELAQLLHLRRHQPNGAARSSLGCYVVPKSTLYRLFSRRGRLSPHSSCTCAGINTAQQNHAYIKSLSRLYAYSKSTLNRALKLTRQTELAQLLHLRKHWGAGPRAQGLATRPLAHGERWGSAGRRAGAPGLGFRV